MAGSTESVEVRNTPDEFSNESVHSDQSKPVLPKTAAASLQRDPGYGGYGL